MTAIKGAAIRKFIARPGAEISGALIYGPDRGRVRERAKKIIASVLGGDNDSFALCELEPAALAADPGLLADELMAIPFMGGRKIVWLRGPDKKAENIILKVIKDTRTKDALLLIEAANLRPSSPLRKAFEKSDHLAAIACFEDDGRSLGEIIDEELARFGHTISRDARMQLIGQLGSDRSLSRSEIEKICLYTGKARRIELEDIEAISGDTSALTMDNIADSIASGNKIAFERDFRRAISSGIPAATILGNVTLHISRLHYIHAHSGEGAALQSLISQLRPPLHFKRRDGFIRQLKLWHEPALRKALKVLNNSEYQSRTGIIDPVTVINRALLQIATLAGSR